jgi:preprotein translocase SecE subunit
MARPTRQARRERREQARADGTAPERARARQQQAVAAVTEPARPEAAPRRRTGVFNFIAECVAELKKVEWPGQRQVMTGTVVVIIACSIVGAYLWGVDLALEPFVERVLLGK